MKNPYLESCYRRMRQYYRHHQWRLEHGVYMPHAYPDNSPPPSWDDAGFILNGRLVMVWWEHPRLKYEALIDEIASEQAGELPFQDLLIDKANYKQVGRSRKKVTSYSMSFSDSCHDRYEKLHALENELKQAGIDRTVQPSFSVKILPWCRGVDLCVPLDIRGKEDLFRLAALVKRLLKRETTLQDEFPEYQYTKADWLSEPNEADHEHLSASL